MPIFIRTDTACVNLAHVTCVLSRRSNRTKGVLRYEFIGPEGYTLGTLEADHFDIEALTAPILPAAPGALAYVVSIDDDSGARPTEADLFIRLLHVIGWRVFQHWIEPILVETTCDGEHVLVVCEDGTLVEPEIQRHANLETAKAEILRQAQEAFDMQVRAA